MKLTNKTKKREAELVSRAMAILGRRKSVAKSAASRENGKLGGRPRKVKPCEDCGRLRAIFQPCPYAEEINDNKTMHWLCGSCANERAMDI